MSLIELAEQLQNELPEVRRRAVIELSRISSLEVFSYILQALDDKDDDVREAALYALADSENIDSLKHLLKPKALFETNPDLRIATIRALGNFRKIGGLPVIGKLLELSRDPEWLVRYTAVSVITEEIEAIKEENDMNSLHSLLYILQLPDAEVHKKTVETLIEIGQKHVEILIHGLTYKSSHVKAGVARVLGELKCLEARDELIKLAEDEDPVVRKEIAMALGKIGGEETVLPLVRMLGDINPQVREKAVLSIAKLGEPVVEALMAELKHTGNKYKKKAIIEALGKIKSDKAIIPLIDCLQCSHNLVRIAAINALSDINNPSSVEALIDVLCINPIDIKNLIDMGVNSNLIRLQIRAIRAIAELKDDRAIPFLSAMLMGDHHQLVKKEVLRALNKIKLAVWAKIGALQVLGRIKAISALPVIKVHLHDADENVVYQALDAIKTMKASEAIKEVMALAEHSEPFIRNKVVTVLGAIGIGNPDVTDVVMARLRDKDTDIRKDAARVLGNLNDKKAIEPLQELIHTCEFWSVRRNACYALNNLGVGKYSVDDEVRAGGIIVTCPYKENAEDCPHRFTAPFCVYRKD